MATTETQREAALRRAPGASAPATLAARHRVMALLRAADDAATRLSLEGRAGVVVPAAGTEALVAGVAAALHPQDWILPAPRHAGIALARGAALVSWLAQVLGRSADPSRGRQEPGHGALRALGIVTTGTSAGARLPQAVGIARAMKRAARGEIVVATCGEPATATPDFHVALNFAGVWEVPVVFVVASDEGADGPRVPGGVVAKASAYGLAGARADGRDVLEVERVVGEAAARAREGHGATLVEVSCSFPQRPSPGAILHLVDADRRAWPGDPVARSGTELIRRGHLTDEQEQDVLREARREVDAAVAEALRLPPVPPSLLFDDVFARRPAHLDRQRAEWLARRSPSPETA